MSNRRAGPGKWLPQLGAAALAGTAIVAALAVVVVVLAVKLRNNDGTSGGATPAQISALEARLTGAERDLAGLRTTLTTFARNTMADLDRLSKVKPTTTNAPLLQRCIVQLQDEIDDLQTYLTNGTPPRGTRVSGACVNLLKPRYRG